MSFRGVNMALPTLYMNPITPGVRAVLMTAKHLDLELNKKYIDIKKGETRTPEFIEMNPQHTVPTLDDNGFILWESYAILTYLVDKYGKDDSLYPKDLQKRATVDQRLHFVNGVLNQKISAIATKMVSEKVVPDQKLFDSLHEAYDFLEAFLEKGFVAGPSLTVADFATVAFLGAIELIEKIDEKKWPRLLVWLRKMEALPCFDECKEGIEKTRQTLLDAKKCCS